jgi:hypothetical protein
LHPDSVRQAPAARRLQTVWLNPQPWCIGHHSGLRRQVDVQGGGGSRDARSGVFGAERMSIPSNIQPQMHRRAQPMTAGWAKSSCGICSRTAKTVSVPGTKPNVSCPFDNRYPLGCELCRSAADPGNRESQLRTDFADVQPVKPHDYAVPLRFAKRSFDDTSSTGSTRRPPAPPRRAVRARTAGP